MIERLAIVLSAAWIAFVCFLAVYAAIEGNPSPQSYGAMALAAIIPPVLTMLTAKALRWIWEG